jgi:predicted phage terminase large subunit-like protein
LDPGYRANLLALPDFEREQLAEGNWNAKPQAGSFFKIGMIEIIEALPLHLNYCRGWDLAATEGAGDWTVGAKLGKDKEGYLYIADILRGQWETSYRDKMIRQTAQRDGQIWTRIPQDPAAAGKSEADRLVRMLSGYLPKSKRVTGNKKTRASALSSQLNAGNVKMLSADWNHGLLQRLDAFPSSSFPDDEIDALADALDELSNKKTVFISNGPSSDCDSLMD